MAVIQWPADIKIGSFDAGIEFDVQFNVMRNGSITSYGLPGGRWVCAIGFEPEIETQQRPRIEALIVRLEGGANRLQMHHHGRPIPNGTMRGTPTVASTTAAGSKSVPIAGANGTLKRGDIIGILGQAVMVTEDATPSGGNMTVSISPPLRSSVNAGTSVIWNRPTINWIPRSPVAGPFPYRPGLVRPGFSCEFIEAY